MLKLKKRTQKINFLQTKSCNFLFLFCKDVKNSMKIEYYCTNEFKMLWLLTLDTYLLILFIAILVLAMHNRKIISHIKKEGELSSLIIIFISFLLLLCMYLLNMFSNSSVSLEDIFIVYACPVAFIPTFLLTALYVPKVIIYSHMYVV